MIFKIYKQNFQPEPTVGSKFMLVESAKLKACGAYIARREQRH
jgi:16S rRNA A1518/A1519 N6-dimethyltransferase RsmA/KsgA/DIM1 with predicted DNA glycosylase/AP lyase activity